MIMMPDTSPSVPPGAAPSVPPSAASKVRVQAAPVRKSSPTLKAYRFFLRSMMTASLIFFITLLILGALAVWGLSLANESPLERAIWFQVFVASAGTYLLVMGIIMPLYLEPALGLGLTRQQANRALLGVALTVSLALALALAVVMALLAWADVPGFGALTAFELLFAVLNHCFLFTVGWLIVVGYQLRHIWSAILTTALGATLYFNFQPWDSGLSGYLMGTSWLASGLGWSGATVSPLYWVYCLIILVCWAVLTGLVFACGRRVAIKV